MTEALSFRTADASPFGFTDEFFDDEVTDAVTESFVPR